MFFSEQISHYPQKGGNERLAIGVTNFLPSSVADGYYDCGFNSTRDICA
jgi:hypothetical protein